jgi:hypothetical protein
LVRTAGSLNRYKFFFKFRLMKTKAMMGIVGARLTLVNPEACLAALPNVEDEVADRGMQKSNLIAAVLRHVYNRMPDLQTIKKSVS